MTTAIEVLDLEGTRLGAGGDEFWAWYPAPAGTAWCMIFQSWALTACGIPTHYAWVSALFDDYRAEGRNTYDIRSAQPGDLVAFEWGSTPGGYDHVAMVLEPTATGLWTRNGNVNGSRVADLWFPYGTGEMAELARPAYINPPTGGSHQMRTLLTMPNGCGVEFCAIFGTITHRWQTSPGSTWSDWVPVVAANPPAPVDSVTARAANSGALEIICWDSGTGVAFRTWQTSFGSTWVDWQAA